MKDQESDIIDQFSYSSNDYHLRIHTFNEDSNFDKAVKEKWNSFENSDVLRYSVKNLEYRVLPGQYGFFVQLNSERAAMRRKPEKIESMLKPFDSNGFNFTKVSNKEILFDFNSKDKSDVVIVNVSPILWSHSLLVTQRFDGLSQNVTLYSFQKALDVLLLSNSENMRVLFNSLCANASVNHLHWHFYYLNYRMPLEFISLQHFRGSLYILKDFPAQGFCVKYSSFKEDIEKFVTFAFEITSCLQKNEIPHNIYITRAKSEPDLQEFDDIRIYIWARTVMSRTPWIIAGACEVFGHVVVNTREEYLQINEDYLCKCLSAYTDCGFARAKEKLEEIL